MKVFGLHIHASHFSCKILGLNTDGGEEVCKGTALGHTHLTFHHVGAETEEGLVAFGADDGKCLVIYTTFIEDAGKLLFRFLQFGTSLYTLHLQQTLLYQFCSPSLYSKVCLCKGYLRLARVTILSYKVASVASQHHIIYLTLSTFTRNYHLINVNKMIRYQLTHILASLPGFIDDVGKILP